MSPADLLTLAAASLYAAYAVGWSHGPFHAFERLRERWPLGGALRCPFCLAFWMALALWLLWQTPARPLIDVFAAAGLAAAAGRYVGLGEE